MMLWVPVVLDKCLRVGNLMAPAMAPEITLEECMEANVEKLRKRFPTGFTERDAEDRPVEHLAIVTPVGAAVTLHRVVEKPSVVQMFQGNGFIYVPLDGLPKLPMEPSIEEFNLRVRSQR